MKFKILILLILVFAVGCQNSFDTGEPNCKEAVGFAALDPIFLNQGCGQVCMDKGYVGSTGWKCSAEDTLVCICDR